MGVDPRATVDAAATRDSSDLAFSDPERLPAPPAAAQGFPSRAPDLDILPGFASPPPGYGEVPFWWWTGDPLDRQRLLWQIEELHAKGVTGMQVNYAHEDSPGWPTYAAVPEVFSEEWWDTWRWVVAECRKRNMGIGLSGYTLDWPGKPGNLFGRLLYSDPETQGQELAVAQRLAVTAGQTVTAEIPADAIAARAYARAGQGLAPEGIDLMPQVKAGQLTWTAPAGAWEIWVVAAHRKPLTLNPMHPEAGRRVVARFFQPCQERAPGGSAVGLNYFFQDELQFGVAGRLWCGDFAEQFCRRKGYDLLAVLPALFADLGPRTAKTRLDYADVKVQLMEERYFRPVFEWHWSRGLIYGCDPGSRGRNPEEFGDYFRCVRWYTAPGHDTPGGQADLIKGKVSSSIAHLYRRPRVWLEGYHSLGWGATPERLLQATCENYVYGCTLLNLHGLYYTTHGGFWEWAPPCYHFRMPYWQHMGVFLRYFERLSYVLSQGVHCCEVAVVYPVAPFDAGLAGKASADTAFKTGQALIADGHDFDFLDFQSLARATVRDGRLGVSGESYGVLVLPALRAVRWSTVEQARRLFRSGGTVVALDALPEASDRAGAADPELDAALREVFGATAAEAEAGVRPPVQRSEAGGTGVFLAGAGEPPPRRYEGGFSGRWVWAKEAVADVSFKGVWKGAPGGPETCRVKLLCDNAGTLYVNGRRLGERADYTTGWTGVADLRPGDVITIDAHDDDNGNHSAGLFFAITRAGETVFSAVDLRYAPTRPTDTAWRTSSDLAGLAIPDTGNVHELHRGRASAGDHALQDALRHVPREVECDHPGKALHRRVGPRDVYFLTGFAQGTECLFRSRGVAELWDPWTGAVQPLHVVWQTPEGSRVRLPSGADQAKLVVFSPGRAAATVTATTLDEVDRIERDEGGIVVRGYAADPGPQTATVLTNGQSLTVSGAAPTVPAPVTLDDAWDFELAPTLDNRWGDFRLPATAGRIGPEARRFRYAVEQAPEPGWEALDLDDSGWAQVTHGYGPVFWQLGPLPADEQTAALDARLASLTQVDPALPVEVGGKAYSWRPYAISWRWGLEGDPGHQGWHGLKENVSDDFVCLGVPRAGLNEVVYGADPAGTRVYLWTAAWADAAGDALLLTGGLQPAAVYLAGARVPSLAAKLPLRAGPNPLLLRYDTPGRGHVVLQRLGAGAAAARTPLAMRWFDLPGRVPFDVRPTATRAGWYRFTAPPGLRGMTIVARGALQAWADGQPLTVPQPAPRPDGARQYSIALPAAVAGLARVALRLEAERGCSAGAALPEPVLLDCGTGRMAAGDWSQTGALECYSGAAWYRRTVSLGPEHLAGQLHLDLGRVAATAEVRCNGQSAGILVAPPWSVDLTPFVTIGANRLEILVCNTLANHYLTTPTRYRGPTVSGLLGPVRLECRPTVELRSAAP